MNSARLKYGDCDSEQSVLSREVRDLLARIERSFPTKILRPDGYTDQVLILQSKSPRQLYSIICRSESNLVGLLVVLFAVSSDFGTISILQLSSISFYYYRADQESDPLELEVNFL